MNQTVTTTETVTFEYDDKGRIVRQVTETVTQSEETPTEASA